MLQQSIGNCATGKLDFTIEFEIYVLATGKMQKEIISNREMKDSKNGKTWLEWLLYALLIYWKSYWIKLSNSIPNVCTTLNCSLDNTNAFLTIAFAIYIEILLCWRIALTGIALNRLKAKSFLIEFLRKLKVAFSLDLKKVYLNSNT